jgi:carbon starvation protein
MSLIIFFISVILFLIGYIFYGRFLNKLYNLNPNNKTPAFKKYDGIDYIPAKNWLVLFGHHFSSIAGAGPIIGPVIASVLWGWLPSILWIILGSIFIGGVHDFSSLFISVREDGKSIGEISGLVISKRTKVLFSLFVFLALILVISVFNYLCAETFINQPKIILPSLGLIPVALIVGYLLYKLKANSFLATIFGIVCLFCLIILGDNFSIKLPINFWIFILFVYCYLASVLPVNILLQPRDYISSFLLFFGIILGFIGLVFSSPKINLEPIITFKADGQYLWPFMFITIACGAISGFHSLIASGTTSKQIANEAHIKRIGYGGMLLEGVLASLAVISVSVLSKDIISLKNPISLFSKGYGIINSKILNNNLSEFIAIVILNAFILTTLDTATRISRYLFEELFKIKNRYLSTFIVVILSALLLTTGKWNKLWQLFGASNQLVASLAMFVISCWLIKNKKNIKIVFVPAIFMFITTLFTIFLKMIEYFKNKDFLFIVAFILILLALFMIYEVFKKLRCLD